ncbi:MAG: Sec-independent protein translocase protein TatB [Pseudomonadota bacterium]
MLDIGLYELVVVGVVALLVVGPKELPGLLRTIGRYVGMIKRQAGEFRAQFDEAIKDTEFDDIRREVDAIKNDTQATMRSVEENGRITDDASRSYGDPNHKPNFNQDELDWMNGKESPSPAEKAAIAAGAAATSDGTPAHAQTSPADQAASEQPARAPAETAPKPDAPSTAASPSAAPSDEAPAPRRRSSRSAFSDAPETRSSHDANAEV